jgi:excisionase family DNA binding protein
MSELQTVRRRPGSAAPPFLTVRDLTTRWRVSRSTVDRLVKAGQLVPTRIGGLLRFDLPQILEFEDRQKES